MTSEPSFAPFLTDVTDLPVDQGCALLARFDVAMLDRVPLPVDLPKDLASAVPKRRAEFLAARALARLIQGRLGLKQEIIARGPNRAPVWPADQTGSITHSAGLAGVWMSRSADLGLGLDFETIPKPSALRAIRETVLVSEERDVVGETPARLCAAFSAKEAIYKALHPRVGRFFGFDAARVTAMDDTEVTLELTRDLAPSVQEGQRYPVRYLPLRGGVCTMIAVA